MEAFMKLKREFIDDILDPDFNFDKVFYSNTGEDIESTCLKCGFTERIPDFIYDEMSRKKYHLKIRKKVSTLFCNKCGKETTIPSSWLK